MALTQIINTGIGQVTNIKIGGSGSANTLDDYEEGTWTPGNASVTLASNDGVYVKIGSLVYATCQVTYPTTSSTGNAEITGLPFNVKSGAANFSGNVSITDFGSDNLYAFTEAGGNKVFIRNNGNSDLTCANLSGKFLNAQLVYRTDA